MRRIPGVVLFLAGPVIWFAHFMLVYLYAEAGCTAAFQPIGPSAVAVFTIVVTVVAAVATAALAVRAVRDLGDDIDGDSRFMRWTGAMLGGLFVLAILLVGAPALAFPTC
jgi:heme/copper-type cytochrome/quinol oxidase subunit 3